MVRDVPRGSRNKRLRDLLKGLGGNGRAAVGTERLSDPGEKESEVIVDLGDRPHGGPRISRHASLVNGDGRREAFDRLHVRPFHLFQKLSGIGRQRFDVPSLSLCKQGVEREGGLAGTAQSGDDHQSIAGDLHVDVLQIVNPGSPDNDVFHVSTQQN